MRPSAVVLDAMGVLYESADDVAELLIPYLRERGCTLPDADVERRYVECSLGELSSTQFWAQTGVAGRADDQEYCRLHTLMPGVPQLLAAVSAVGVPIACLSNDVSSWSALLRRRFDLTEPIRHWVISGDVGVRKPDPGIYHELLRRLDLPAGEVWFVDDRARNVDAARGLGFTALHFGTDVTSMSQLTTMATAWT